MNNIDASKEQPTPILVVISGPSGVGKDAVLNRMRELGSRQYFTVTATTRSLRPGETDGVDYCFVTKEMFQQMIEHDELLEWAEVYGNYYGSPKSQIRDNLSLGRNVILKIDIQGAAAVRDMLPQALSIFIAPPSFSELERRLRERMTESPDELALRLRIAEQEIQESSKFDYIVTNRNGKIDDAVSEIERIIDKEERRTPPRIVSL